MSDNLNLTAEISVRVDSKGIPSATQQVRELAGAATAASKSLDEIAKAQSRSQASPRTGAVANQLRQEAKAHEAVAAAAAKSAAAQEKANRIQIQEMSRARYALYDVATTYGVIATGALGLAAVWTNAGVSFERDFASVIRTSGLSAEDSIRSLERSLVDLTTNMPSSFGDVTQVATIGGQLGVAAGDVDAFTESIIRFATTTNVSVEAAATQMGRLAQLTKTPISEIENLSSAIYLTGINAVATEADILAIASNIATAGDLAGFSAAQIVGLSSAFASLGIAPERARGSVQRVFGQITAAISDGGDALQGFADVSGLTAQQISESWGTDSQMVFSAFVEGLNQIQQAGGDTNAMLKDLGIGAVRDIQSLQALANNTELYQAALEDTATGYANASETQKGYAIQNDTVAATLQKLKNTILATMAAANTNAPLKGLLKGLLSLADAALAITRTPVGGTIALVVVAAIAATGAFALLRTGVALAQASLYGLLVATDAMRGSTDRTAVSLRSLVSALWNFSSSSKGAAAAATTTNAALARTAGSAQSAAVGLSATSAASNATATGMGRAAVAVRGFGVAAKGALVSTGIGLAIVAIGTAVQSLVDSFESASSKAEKFFGSTSGLADALRADTEAGIDAEGALGAYVSTVETSTQTLSENAVALGGVLGTQVSLRDSTATTTDTVSSQSIVVGKNTQEWVLNALATGEASDAMVSWYGKYSSSLGGIQGFDLGELIKLSIDPNGDALARIKEMQAAVSAAQQKLRDDAGYYEAYDDPMFDKLAAQQGALRELIPLLENVGNVVSTTAAKQEVLSAASEAMGINYADLTDEAGAYGEAASGAAGKTQELTDALFGIIGATVSVEEAMFNMGESIATNGTSFDYLSENGRANLAVLEASVTSLANAAGSDMGAFTNNLAIMLANLESSGVSTSQELYFVQDQLLGLVNSQYGLNLDTTAARQSIADFIASAIAALQTRAQLERAAQQRVPMERDPVSGVSRPAIGGAGPDHRVATPEIDAQIAGLQKLQKQVSGVKNTQTNQNKSYQDGLKKGTAAVQKAADKAGKAAKGAADKSKDAIKEVKEELRTLLDYASDLREVVDRAFDIRFSVQVAEDAVASQYEAIQKTADDAAKAIIAVNQKIRDTNASIDELRASNRTLAYQLTVAVAYGDTLRESEIRAQMSKNNSDIGGLQLDLTGYYEDLSKAQDDASMTLTGYTAAARRNRAAVMDLVQANQKEILALAQSGASTETLQRRTNELRAEFTRQLTQMGFNRAETDRYSAAFGDLAVAIDRVPRNITVSANADPAQQALNEFIARNTNRNIPLTATISAPNSIGGGTYNASGINVGGGGISTPRINTDEMSVLGKWLGIPYGLSSTGGLAGHSADGGPVRYLASGGDPRNFPGQPTGTDTIPTWLTPGEFVQQKAAVDYYGLPFMTALNNMQIPRTFNPVSPTSNAGGSSGGNGIQLVELLPTQVKQIVDAVNVSVGITPGALAGAVNGRNKQSSTRSAA